MSRVKIYNCEEYSLFDIIKFLQENGYRIRYGKKDDEDVSYKEYMIQNKPDDYYVRTYPADMIHVIDTDVYFDFPDNDGKLNYYNCCIRFEDYPKTKFYESSKKLYEKVKRKFGTPQFKTEFGITKDYFPQSIKDEEKINAVDWEKFDFDNPNLEEAINNARKEVPKKKLLGIF